MREQELSKKDVRRIANKIPNCTEVKSKSSVNVLSFLKSTERADHHPARIQVYCDTGTVITLRVFNGAIRQIFQRNCTLEVVGVILKNPPELSLINLDEQLKLGQESSESSCNCNDSDGHMLEIGETILAAESEALKAHYFSLTGGKEEKLTSVLEYACSFPEVIMDQVERMINASTKENDRITCAATDGPSSVFLLKSGRWRATDNIPKAVFLKLKEHESATKPKYVSLGTRKRYFLSFANGKQFWEGPKTMDVLFFKKSVRCVAFGRAIDDVFVVYQDSTWKRGGKMPEGLEQLLKEEKNISDNLDCVTMGANGEYFVKSKDGQMFWGGVSDKITQVFNEQEEENKTLEFIDFGGTPGSAGSYFMICS